MVEAPYGEEDGEAQAGASMMITVDLDNFQSRLMIHEATCWG